MAFLSITTDTYTSLFKLSDISVTVSTEISLFEKTVLFQIAVNNHIVTWANKDNIEEVATHIFTNE